MIQSLLENQTVSTLSMSNAIIFAVCAGILGVLISLTYMKTGKVSVNFSRTLIVLPILVCIVMLAVNGNFGTSLAVVGAFSLVRFRSLQGSSRDIAFIFFAMTVGIVCAVGEIFLAGLITALVCVIELLLAKFNYGKIESNDKNLRITMPENLDYKDVFTDIFEKYTSDYKQISVKTTNMGSLYEVNYKVKLLDDMLEKEFIDSIRVRNGNLNVVCGRVDSDINEEL